MAAMPLDRKGRQSFSHIKKKKTKTKPNNTHVMYLIQFEDVEN